MSQFIAFTQSNVQTFEKAVNEALKDGWKLINCSATEKLFVAFLIKEGAIEEEGQALKKKYAGSGRRDRW
ncbi:MAG: hypothetical protein ACFFB3_21010 [Candidatus Hodarchaeota archaeon]